jgi:hypothetical protein
VCIVLEQVEQEISKNNNLRAEVINLTSMILSEKRKNNFCQEKNYFLQSEIESKNLIIKNKNSTIQENTVKATNKMEKQRVSYKEDRNNLLRYVIEQNEVANELSKTIQFMRAVISTSTPSPSLPSNTNTNTNTNTDATLLSSSPSLSLPSPLLTIEDEDEDDLNEGEGRRTNTLQQDIRIDQRTVYFTVDNLDDSLTDLNEMSIQGDNVRGEREEGDGEKEEEGEGEKEDEGKRGVEREVMGQLVRKESHKEGILKGGNEDKEEEEEDEKEKDEGEEGGGVGEEGRGGDEGGSDETGIEGSKAQQQSVMLRSKLFIELD